MTALGDHADDRRRSRRTVATAFVAVLVLVNVVTWAAMEVLGVNNTPLSWSGFPGRFPLEGWLRWDSGWYMRIATLGYQVSEDVVQTTVAFYPVYPALVRVVAATLNPTPLDGWAMGPEALDWIRDDIALAGIAVAMASGFAAVLLFHEWARTWLSERATVASAVVLLTYPFAFFLLGPAYSDGFFLAAALASFVLLERGRPVLAGLAGIVAAASRPVGIALVVGLAVRAYESRRRGAVESGRRLAVAPSLAAVGLLVFPAYLWLRFGEPLASVRAVRAWGLDIGPSSWLKEQARDILTTGGFGLSDAMVVVQASVTVLFLLAVPAVARRFGLGYAAYTLVVIGLPAVQSASFIGLGRYALAAFPVFGLVGEWLVQRAPLLRLSCAAGLAGQLVLATFFARWFYVS